MSEMERLEERLRAFAAAQDGGADWQDVLRRAGGRLRVPAPRRRLALALAVLVAAAAAVVGVLVTSGRRPARAAAHGLTGVQGPTGARGVTGAAGPTNTGGPTGSVGPTYTGGATGRVGPTGTAGPTGLGATAGRGPTGALRPTSRIGPAVFTAAELTREAMTLPTPVYWAGPRDAQRYEFTRTTNGAVYVLYLPRGPERLVVATYPSPGAFAALKKRADGKAIAGPHGSVYFVNANPRNVSVAFPNVDYEIEINDASPAVALAIAQSGAILPVG